MGQTKDTKALHDNFTVTVGRKKGVTEMTLVPRGKNEAITKIVIAFKDDYTPLFTTIVELRGDETTLEFTKQKVNVPIDDAVFDVIIPAGVVVEDIGG